MNSKKHHGAKQRDLDSEESVTNETVTRKRSSPSEDTECLTSIKKRRYSADDTVAFVHRETPSSENEVFVTAPLSVTKSQASPPSVRDDEGQETVTEKARIQQDILRSKLKKIGVRILEKEVKAMTDCVCQYLGAGAYGSCIRTVDPHTQKQVVVKTFNDDYHSLFLETKNLHRFQIGGVQRLMGVCIESCQLLTYFAGDTAINYFEKNVPFVDAAIVFLQTARTLKNITTRGFTHNDLKYDNVCVSDEGKGIVATIIDLGLMKPIGTERVTRTKRHPHAKPWVAPELVTQTLSNSEASDAYSLAFMMYAMLIMKRLSQPGRG